MAVTARIALAAAIALALCGCTAQPATGGPPSAPAASADARDGMVDLGDGRSMFLTCRGSGAPTVVLVSGTGGAADEWKEQSSAESVFSALSTVTRVCAYDRPGTTLADGSRSPSTPVAQPTTAMNGVDDLDALLAAAGESGPFVLVGASWGGLIAQLFARAHPDETAGLVLVDSASGHLHETFTAAQWQAWMTTIESARPDPDAETPAYVPTLQKLADAPPVPAVVLSSDRPWDLQVTPGASTWPAWLAAQSALAASLGAEHVSSTHSGHGIHVEQPALVADAVADVLAKVRGG